jgi:hypothetical protein
MPILRLHLMPRTMKMLSFKNLRVRTYYITTTFYKNEVGVIVHNVGQSNQST